MGEEALSISFEIIGVGLAFGAFYWLVRGRIWVTLLAAASQIVTILDRPLNQTVSIPGAVDLVIWSMLAWFPLAYLIAKDVAKFRDRPTETPIWDLRNSTGLWSGLVVACPVFGAYGVAVITGSLFVSERLKSQLPDPMQIELPFILKPGKEGIVRTFWLSVFGVAMTYIAVHKAGSLWGYLWLVIPIGLTLDQITRKILGFEYLQITKQHLIHKTWRHEEQIPWTGIHGFEVWEIAGNKMVLCLNNPKDGVFKMRNQYSIGSLGYDCELLADFLEDIAQKMPQPK